MTVRVVKISYHMNKPFEPFLNLFPASFPAGITPILAAEFTKNKSNKLFILSLK